MCFSTAEKVIGLIKLPLDGNPHKSAGLIAHPGEISNVVVSHDGKYLLTCGHNDCTVNLWSVNTDALEAQVAFGGSGMEPFLRMLNTGENFNDEFREMEDLFYYAQLRSQGEDTMSKRTITQAVNITEIPSILRSYGYYPSEDDIANILNEIKLTAALSADKDQHTISFDDLLKS
ncbi:hypothetical protein BKA69DRAFT_899625 [Paraphysoderma sedebokerense]|nr:hypothetical protein BKA69DRAFT_899625 [Paraphysoderma sedebokerense]